MGLECLWSLCDSITVPKLLAIKNQRLGILFRILQIGAIVLIMLMVFVSKSWNTQQVPVSYGLEFWAEDGPASAMQNPNVTHCSNVGSYAYNYTSTDHYDPAECKLLAKGESFLKQGVNLYVPIHIKDTYTTEVPLSQCSNFTCNPPSVKRETSVQCLCEQKSEYFAKNPEQILLFLNHGFEVPKVNLYGQKDKIPTKARSAVNYGGDDDNILTVITKDGDDSKRCEISGKSEWTLSDARNGITGSIADWIRCGGSSLDDDAPNAISGEAGYSTPPKVRVVGMSLQISLVYKNAFQSDVDWPGPVCYVRITALPIWNSVNSIQFTQIPHAGSPGSTYRYRYAFGISISIQATGTFYWFDLNELILTITSSLVLISIPGIIVQLIALNFAGRISDIYSAVAIENFSIVDRFGGICARLLGYASNFKAIIGQKEGGEWVMTTKTLDDKLKEVLADQMQPGKDGSDPVLNEKEVMNMSKFLIHQLDPDGKEKVELVEYLRACNSQEAIKIKDLAAFFDDQRKRTCLEAVFGDVSKEIRTVQKEIASSGSAKVVPVGGDLMT